METCWFCRTTRHFQLFLHTSYINYLLLLNKLPQTCIVLLVKTIGSYYFTVSVRQETRYALARCNYGVSGWWLDWEMIRFQDHAYGIIRIQFLTGYWTRVSVPHWLLARSLPEFLATWAHPKGSLQYGSWSPQTREKTQDRSHHLFITYSLKW